MRSSRNALKRHADSIRDEQSKLACRSLLVALHGNMTGIANPAELLGVLEQVQHVLHATRRDDSQLPVALRAVVAFATDTPGRQREVQELVRLALRHLYALNADHRADPGIARAAEDEPPPIRNCEAGNLALSLLQLPAVPGSVIGRPALHLRRAP